MATTKDIEEILGIPKSKIESWSRARDSNYVLVKFLKSFSRFELNQRVQSLFEDSDTVIVPPEKFIKKLKENIGICGIREFAGMNGEEVELVSQPNRGLSTIGFDMLLKANNTYYAIEFKHLLPSLANLERNIEKMEQYAKENKWDLSRIIYIINNKTVPETILEKVGYIASFYRFDDIAKNLYGKKVILEKPI